MLSFRHASVSVLVAVVIAAPALAAQDLRVNGEGVRLRAGASKFTRIQRLLDNGEPLELVRPDSLRNGFFHVRTGELEGWVGQELVERIPPPLPGQLVRPIILDAANPSSAISSSWEKPPLLHTTFRNGTHSCGPFGGGGDNADPVTNEQKNRADVPMLYHAVTFDAIGDTTRLRFPHGFPTRRVSWTKEAQIVAQREFVTPFEGIPVAVVGHINVIRPQAGSPESTNCGLTSEAATDWHMALVRAFGDPESTAVVVEPSPRMKQLHGDRWTRARLRRHEPPNSSPGDSVRISGFLMLDPAHPTHLGKHRHTLWEIHPVTRIEVFRDGQWRDLDDEP